MGLGSDFPLTTPATAGHRPLPRPRRGRVGRHPPLPAAVRAPRRGPDPRGYNFPLPLQLLLRGPAGGGRRRTAGPGPGPDLDGCPSAPRSPHPLGVPPRLRPDEAAAPGSTSAMFQASAPFLRARRSPPSPSPPPPSRRRPHPTPPRHLYQRRRAAPRHSGPARPALPAANPPDSASAPRRPRAAAASPADPAAPRPLRSAQLRCAPLAACAGARLGAVAVTPHAQPRSGTAGAEGGAGAGRADPAHRPLRTRAAAPPHPGPVAAEPGLAEGAGAAGVFLGEPRLSTEFVCAPAGSRGLVTAQRCAESASWLLQVNEERKELEK